MSSQPIPSREQAVSFSVSPDSPQATALLYYLNNVNAQELHTSLVTAIKSHRVLPCNVEKIYVALTELGLITNTILTATSDQTIRHCARCHQTYMEKNNGNQSCVILHERPSVVKLMKNVEAPPYKNYYACCNTLADLGSATARPYCFVGRHTTIADNVRFNRVNIWPCEQRKCGSNINALERFNGGPHRPSTMIVSRVEIEAPRATKDNEMT